MKKSKKLNLILFSPFAFLALFLVLTFVGQKLNFDFTSLQKHVPFADAIVRIPLISLIVQNGESGHVVLHASKLVIEIGVYFYIFTLSIVCAVLFGLFGESLLHPETVNLGLFYWMLFGVACGVTLFFFPTEIWGEKSLAFRIAVYSDFRFVLFSLFWFAAELWVLVVTTYFRNFAGRLLRNQIH